MTASLRKTGGNALAILSSDVMNRATSFVLYALVARNLGVHEFGKLALAFTLFYAFQVFAAAGLKTLIIREVAKDRAQTWRYFVHGGMAAAISSLGSLLTLWAFIRAMRYPPDTTAVILLLCLGVVPYAFSSVCEAIFQAWEQMRYIAFVNVPVNAAKIGGAFLLLSGQHGLHMVVLIIVLSMVAVAGIEAWILVRRFPRQPASFDPRFSLRMLRSGSTFLAIDGVIAVESGLSIILLSKLAGAKEVGLYCAAMQVMVPLSLVYQSAAQSVFPVMCRKAEPGLHSLRQIAESAMEMLLILALPAVAGMFFLGDWVLSLVYKYPVFVQAFPAVRIAAWILIFQVFTSVLGQVLVATHREKTTLKIVAVALVTTLFVGGPLISQFGLIGAAVASLLTKLVGCIQHYLPVRSLFSPSSLIKIVWKPAVAAACMTAYLMWPAGHARVLSGLAAAVIYLSVLLTLNLWVAGGLREFKAKYLPLLSR